MHEISLCQNILRIIETQAAAEHFCKVKTIWLEVGALAGVEVEALRFGFDVVMKDSIAAGAHLEVVHVPGTAWCEHCARQVSIVKRYDVCPDCSQHPAQVTGGDGLRVLELEVL